MTTALTYLASALGLLAAIVPSVIVALGFGLANPLVMMEGYEPTAALGESWRRMDGLKTSVFWAAVAFGLLGAAASVVTSFVQVLVFQVAVAQNPEALLAHDAVSAAFWLFIHPLAWLPFRVLDTVTYVKVLRHGGETGQETTAA